jgi:hypothetical protein
MHKYAPALVPDKKHTEVQSMLASDKAFEVVHKQAVLLGARYVNSAIRRLPRHRLAQHSQLNEGYSYFNYKCP